MNYGNSRNMWKRIPTKRLTEIVNAIRKMPEGLYKDALSLCFIEGKSPRAAAIYAQENNLLIGKRKKPISCRRIEQIICEYFPDVYDYGKSARPQRTEKNKNYLELRRELVKTKEQKCYWCGSTEYIEWDHIIPRALGGTSDPRNLQPLCRECHKIKTGYEHETFPEQYKWKKSKVVFDDGSEQIRF